MLRLSCACGVRCGALGTREHAQRWGWLLLLCEPSSRRKGKLTYLTQCEIHGQVPWRVPCPLAVLLLQQQKSWCHHAVAGMFWPHRSGLATQDSQRPELLLVGPRCTGVHNAARWQKSRSTEVVAVPGGFDIRDLLALGAVLVIVWWLYASQVPGRLGTQTLWWSGVYNWSAVSFIVVLLFRKLSIVFMVWLYLNERIVFF